MAREFKVIDLEKFEKEINESAERLRSKDGLARGKRLESIGLAASSLNVMKDVAARHPEHKAEDYGCKRIGMVGIARMNIICDAFKLDPEDYYVSVKSEEVQEKPIENIEVVDRTDEILEVLNKLGNVLMQSMEYQKECMNYLASMNAKYNKPSAYIPRKQ